MNDNTKPLLSWSFGENVSWEFYESSSIPEDKLCMSACWLFFHNNSALLVENKRWWEIPWWHREEWETIEETLLREMKEEIWIDLVEWEYKVWWYRKVICKEPLENKSLWWYYPSTYYLVHYIWQILWDISDPTWDDVIDFKLFTKNEVENSEIRARELIKLWFDKIMW